MLAGLAGLAGGAGATTLATIASAAAPVFGGMQAMSKAKGEKQRAENNAFIGTTRAIQTNVQAREGLNAELGTLRATLAANGQRPGVGTDVIFNELRRTSNQDRRVEFSNEMQGAADWRMQGRNAMAGGQGDLLGGFVKAGPSLFDLYQLRRNRG